MQLLSCAISASTFRISCSIGHFLNPPGSTNHLGGHLKQVKQNFSVLAPRSLVGKPHPNIQPEFHFLEGFPVASLLRKPPPRVDNETQTSAVACSHGSLRQPKGILQRCVRGRVVAALELRRGDAAQGGDGLWGRPAGRAGGLGLP